VKEAYEFSILNPFLINEEELDNLMRELDKGTGESGYNTNASGRPLGGGLELHQPKDDSSKSEEESNESSEGEEESKNGKHGLKLGGKLSGFDAMRAKGHRKSLMNIDLDRIAADAQNKGE